MKWSGDKTETMRESGIIGKIQQNSGFALWNENSLELTAKALLTLARIPTFKYIRILIAILIYDFSQCIHLIFYEHLEMMVYITGNTHILWWKIT